MHYPRIVDGLLVRHTGAKGYGLFAQRPYNPQEIIARVDGVKIHDTDKRLTHRGVQIAPRHFLEPKRFSAVWYLNHGCMPNAYIDGDTLLARQRIKPGEEITADYSLFIDYPSWDMDCSCRATTCRKLIVAHRLLPSRPTKFVSGYLKKK